MANGLLGTYIATFSTSDIASDGTTTFAHDLGGIPDFVIIHKIETTTFATENSQAPDYTADATNVTFVAAGLPTGDFRAAAVVAHSIIQ